MKNLFVILILTQLLLSNMIIMGGKENSFSYNIGKKLLIKDKITNMESKGHLENLIAVTKKYDVLSIVPADILIYINKLLPRKIARVRVVTKLPNIQVHLIVKKSSSFYSLDDLIGKKINIGNEFQASDIFSSIFQSYFSISWQQMRYSTDIAFKHLLNGYKKLDAIILIGKAPIKIIEKNLSKIRFIELPMIGGYNYDIFELKDKYEIFESKKTLEIPLLLLVNRGYDRSNKAIINNILDKVRNIYNIDTCIEPSISVNLNFEFAKKQFCYKRSIK